LGLILEGIVAKRKDSQSPEKSLGIYRTLTTLGKLLILCFAVAAVLHALGSSTVDPVAVTQKGFPFLPKAARN